MEIDVRPATSFDDVRTVIGPGRPDATVCWRLSYRIPSRENQALRGPARGTRVRALLDEDPPPGVLAFDGDEAVGWAAVHPRPDTTFARNRKIPHVDAPDDDSVWAVWCIRVRPGHRGQGVSHALLAGAVEFAAEHGARVVEGYPVDNRGARVDRTMAYVGTRGLFERAGFEHVADTTSVLAGHPRVLVRRVLRA